MCGNVLLGSSDGNRKYVAGCAETVEDEYSLWKVAEMRGETPELVQVSLRNYSLARVLIQIGVPTNPNARRIWFSRKRWYEKCNLTRWSVNKINVGGATEA